MFADDALGKRRVFFAEHSLVDDARVRVHDLYHHLAARNLAIVQGGLTTPANASLHPPSLTVAAG